MSDSALRTLAAGIVMPGFVGRHVPPWIAEARVGGLRCVGLYGGNVTDRAGALGLCAQLRGIDPGLLIATDEEGGDVTRLHLGVGSPTPGNAVLGRIDDQQTTRYTAQQIGAELASVGIGLDLAPSADVNSNDRNPVIGTRSFGADPRLVARHTVAFVEGLQSTGVAACAKHFPGHGHTSTDTHVTRAVVRASRSTLAARELVPFAAAIQAGVATVMTSHVLATALDPDAPATFSARVLQGLLRGELGFSGVIVSDALDMAGSSAESDIPTAAVRAVAAGADLLCLGADTTEELYRSVLTALCGAAADGTLPRRRLTDAADRVADLADRHAVAAAPAGADRPGALGPATPMGPSPDRILPTFARRASVTDWLAAAGPTEIVQVETSPNLAIGPAAWGPASVGATTPADRVSPGARVAVVARGIGPGHPARAAAAAYRAAGHAVVLVDCGWPQGDVDLATYSGARSVSTALVALLRGEIR